MFKKLVKIGGQNQLSGKDRKILKNELVQLMGAQEVEHFFSKNEKIICQKVSGSKVLIYVTDDYPAFVDGTGKSDFFPTLYTMGAYPNIVPSLTLCEGVETFIFNGANLMWPGVADYSQLGDFVKEEIVAVRNSKGEFVAVAGLAINRKDLNQQTKSGIACHVLHYLNDKLWEHGSKVMPPLQMATGPKVPAPPAKAEPKVEAPKEQPKIEEKPEVKKDQGKKKKEEPKKEEPAKEEEVPKPKEGKGKKDKKKAQEEPKEEPKKEEPKKEAIKKEQIKKQQPKKQVPKQPEPQQESSEQQDLAALLHHKKQNAPVPKKVEIKKGGFSDDQDDDDRKKKKGKKPQKKEEEHHDEVKKEKPKGGKGKKHQEDEQEEEKPKPKGKKQRQQESDEEVEKPKKKDQDDSDEDDKRKKGKKGKKDNKKEEESEEEVRETKGKKGKGKKKESDNEEDQDKDVEKSALTPHIMDEYFKEALLNALKLGVDDDQLPMDSGLFFTQYILPGRKEGVTLDIKQSNYKKMNKFFEAMDKLGLLQFKQGKQKSGAVGPTINKIHRDCEILVDHIPTIKKLAQKDVEEQEKDFGPVDPKLKFQMSSTVEVNEVYKLAPPKKETKEKEPKQKKDKKKDKEKEQLKQVKEEPNILEFLFPRKDKEVEKQKQKDHKGHGQSYDPNEYYTQKQVKQRIAKYLAQFEEEIKKKVEPEVEEDKGKKKKKQEDIQEQGKKKKGVDYLYINYKNDPFIQKLLADEIEQHQDFLKAQENQEQSQQQKDDAAKQKEKDKDKSKNKKKKERETRDKQLLKITKEDIERKVMEHLEPYHQISDKPNGVLEFHADRFKGIHVTAEKNSNKNVTTLSGVELFIIPKNKIDQQIANLIQLLQQKFNCSVSAHNLPKKNAGKQLMIQGNFLDQVVDMLMIDYKIKKDYITTTNKLEKKKKNN